MSFNCINLSVMDLWLWFKAYLGGRLQCVDLGNSRSDLVHVISGVPQGSILGPLFTSMISLMIAYPGKCSRRVVLQDNLNSICDGCNTWKMKLNGAKCVC